MISSSCTCTHATRRGRRQLLSWTRRKHTTVDTVLRVAAAAPTNALTEVRTDPELGGRPSSTILNLLSPFILNIDKMSIDLSSPEITQVCQELVDAAARTTW